MLDNRQLQAFANRANEHTDMKLSQHMPRFHANHHSSWNKGNNISNEKEITFLSNVTTQHPFLVHYPFQSASYKSELNLQRTFRSIHAILHVLG